MQPPVLRWLGCACPNHGVGGCCSGNSTACPGAVAVEDHSFLANTFRPGGVVPDSGATVRRLVGDLALGAGACPDAGDGRRLCGGLSSGVERREMGRDCDNRAGFLLHMVVVRTLPHNERMGRADFSAADRCGFRGTDGRALQLLGDERARLEGLWSSFPCVPGVCPTVGGPGNIWELSRLSRGSLRNERPPDHAIRTRI